MLCAGNRVVAPSSRSALAREGGHYSVAVYPVFFQKTDQFRNERGIDEHFNPRSLCAL